MTGGNGVDIFIFEYVSDSLLPNFDVIKDLKIGVDNINAQRAVNAADVVQLGNINALAESQIQGLLNITTFVANKAAIFSLGTGANQQTFLALNDAINGFSASNDAIIEITGFNGNLAKLAIV
nr:bluetail domain-containing putative surface protein [Komarekiella delphini-convector]